MNIIDIMDKIKVFLVTYKTFLWYLLIISNCLIILGVLLFSNENDINAYSGSYSEKYKNRKVHGAELFLNRLLFILITVYFLCSFALYYFKIF